MHSLRKWALPGALLVMAACSTDSLSIPNYNSPTVDGVATDPNGVQLLVTGIQAGQRGGHAGWVSDAGIFARESYNYFPTDARTVSNYLVGILNPQRLERAGFASGNWTGPYQNMKNEVNLIAAVNASSLAADKKNGAIGFAKTMRAYDLYIIAASRDSLGGPTEIPDDPSTAAPFVTRDSMYKAITGFLDEGKTALAGAGSSFAFGLRRFRHAGDVPQVQPRPQGARRGDPRHAGMRLAVLCECPGRAGRVVRDAGGRCLVAGRARCGSDAHLLGGGGRRIECEQLRAAELQVRARQRRRRCAEAGGRRDAG
jgi:hypothetical protein